MHMTNDMTFAMVQLTDMENIAQIINSNEAYNVMENGNALRSRAEIAEQFDPADPQISYLIQYEGHSVGVLQYLPENPKDGQTWLGLLMIHASLRAQGYGKLAYQNLEQLLQQQGKRSLRLGVIPENQAARRFWEALGFQQYDSKMSSIGKVVDCFEKVF